MVTVSLALIKEVWATAVWPWMNEAPAAQIGNQASIA